MSLKFAKTVFIFLCVVFLCLGIVLSALALWTLHDENSRLHLLYPTLVKDLAPVLWIIAVIGILIAAVSMVGICGVYRESRCCLIIYFVVVLATLIGMTACVIAAVVLLQLDPEGPKRIFYQRLIEDYAFDNPFQSFIDQIQTDLRCCGVYNYTDFQSTPWYTKEEAPESTREKVPSSCCNVQRSNAEAAVLVDDCQQLRNTSLIFSNACPAALNSWFGIHRGWLIAVAVIIGVLNIVLLIVVCHIQSRVNGEYAPGRFV